MSWRRCCANRSPTSERWRLCVCERVRQAALAETSRLVCRNSVCGCQAHRAWSQVSQWDRAWIKASSRFSFCAPTYCSRDKHTSAVAALYRVTLTDLSGSVFLFFISAGFNCTGKSTKSRVEAFSFTAMYFQNTNQQHPTQPISYNIYYTLCGWEAGQWSLLYTALRRATRADRESGTRTRARPAPPRSALGARRSRHPAGARRQLAPAAPLRSHLGSDLAHALASLGHACRRRRTRTPTARAHTSHSYALRFTHLYQREPVTCELTAVT